MLSQSQGLKIEKADFLAFWGSLETFVFLSLSMQTALENQISLVFNSLKTSENS